MSISNNILTKEHPYFVSSDKLRELKNFINKMPQLNEYFGDTIEYRLVVDTNIILADVRWLALNRKSPSARTSLMEIIDSGVATVYAPKKLVEEVNEHLPNIASEFGIALNTLRREWNTYKTKLKISAARIRKVSYDSKHADPDDLDFIVMAKRIKAHGIISNDPHIEKMGGNKISLDFIFSLRDYARATSIELNIKVMGVSFGFILISAKNS